MRITPTGWPTNICPTWERLPTTTPADVTQAIKDLARMSCGRAVHVVSDSDEIKFCWALATGDLSTGITCPTGHYGIDVFWRWPGETEWIWAGAGVPTDPNNNVLHLAMASALQREYLIYMPSFRRVAYFEIHTPTSRFVAAGPAPAELPIVVLGTSIVQGSGSSRPGNNWPARLARRLNRDVVNLGFAGQCNLAEGLGSLVSQIAASEYFIDPFPNMTHLDDPVKGITNQMGAFIDVLATAWPDRLIWFIEARRAVGGGPHPLNQTTQEALTNAARPIFEEKALTHTNLRWIWAHGDMLGTDDTVDGSHPHDGGYARMADYIFARRAEQLAA
jgi:hypothetical protein